MQFAIRHPDRCAALVSPCPWPAPLDAPSVATVRSTLQQEFYPAPRVDVSGLAIACVCSRDEPGACDACRGDETGERRRARELRPHTCKYFRSAIGPRVCSTMPRVATALQPLRPAIHPVRQHSSSAFETTCPPPRGAEYTAQEHSRRQICGLLSAGATLHWGSTRPVLKEMVAFLGVIVDTITCGFRWVAFSPRRVLPLQKRCISMKVNDADQVMSTKPVSASAPGQKAHRSGRHHIPETECREADRRVVHAIEKAQAGVAQSSAPCPSVEMSREYESPKIYRSPGCC